MPRVLPFLAALPLALAACAGGAPSAGRCTQAFASADGLLRAGLAEYVRRTNAFTAALNPGAGTKGAEARLRASAEAWTAAHREDTVRACRGWPEERLVCVLAAEHATELAGCGLEPLVRSFTDEVVAVYAARPFDASR